MLKREPKKRQEKTAVKAQPRDPPKLPKTDVVQPLKAVTWGDMVAEEEELDAALADKAVH